MRVLHVDLGREMRGGQRQVLLLMKGLRERGHLCELLARPNSPLWQAATVAGFTARAASLRTLLQRAKSFDIVHAHDAHAHTHGALLTSDKLVVSRRVAFAVRSGVGSRWKYRRVRKFLAVSRFVASELEKAGVERQRIDVVYDGVELMRYRSNRSSRGTVVALDSQDPGKGRDLVEQASALCRVPVLFSANLSADLPDASLFLYITRSEGLGSAALLAMSLGVPVIASNLGGLPEIVRDGETGRLVSNEPETIAAAILALRDDTSLTSYLAHNARLLVEQEFTPQRMVERTLENYAQLCAGNLQARGTS